MLTTGLALTPVGAPGPVAAQSPRAGEAVAVAQAFVRAWNTGALPAAVASFTPDATIRQPIVRLAASPASGDPGAETLLADDIYGPSLHPTGYPSWRDGDFMIWASGTDAIAAWMGDLQRRRHSVAAANYRVVDDAVAWHYWAFVDPFQQVPGVGPTEGEMAVVVRGGQIAALTVSPEPASVRRRAQQVHAAGARGAGRLPAASRRGEAGLPNPQARHTPSVAPWLVALAASLAGPLGLALLGRFGRPASWPTRVR
jgi:hypothetical protein